MHFLYKSTATIEQAIWLTFFLLVDICVRSLVYTMSSAWLRYSLHQSQQWTKIVVNQTKTMPSQTNPNQTKPKPKTNQTKSNQVQTKSNLTNPNQTQSSLTEPKQTLTKPNPNPNQTKPIQPQTKPEPTHFKKEMKYSIFMYENITAHLPLPLF